MPRFIEQLYYGNIEPQERSTKMNKAVDDLLLKVVNAIMSEEKPNQRERIKLSAERVREYFPKSYTTQQMEDTIFKLLEQWHRQQRKRNDAR